LISSVIFVHGLGSNPDTTWQGKKTLENGNIIRGTQDSKKVNAPIDWITHLAPYDLEPKFLKGARMFYYNYDSYWFRDAIEVRLEDLATKLLVDMHSNRQISGKVR
jgi:hypothetical protein